MTRGDLQGNPQGKGLTPVLDDWRDHQASRVAARNAQALLSDYFVALLVLSAEFAFKPVPGNDYFLYLRDQRWLLSLISPAEWGKNAPGPCLGRCALRDDMTWALQPGSEVRASDALRAALAAFHDGFLAMVERHDTLEDSLPYYVATLPYYRRLLAAGLANSLNHSLKRSRLSGRGTRQWLSAASSAALLPDNA